MSYKATAIIILLMFVFLMGIFFLKSGSILLNIKEELIYYLESSYGLDLEVKDANFWPLNQIILTDVSLESLKTNINVHASELRVYYDFFDMIINRDHPLTSINYIEIQEPVIDISNQPLPGKVQKKGIDKERPLVQKDFLDRLGTIGIAMNNAQIKYQGDKNKIQLKNLNLNFKALANNNCLASVESGLVIEKWLWKNKEINDVEIDEIELSLNYKNSGWQASLRSNYFTMNNFLPVVKTFNKNNYSISKLGGQVKFNLNLTGKNMEIQDYSGNILLREVNSIISAGEYIEDRKIEGLQGEIVFNSRVKKFYFKDFQFAFSQNPFYLNGSIDFASGNQPRIFTRLTSSNLNLEGTGFGEYINNWSLFGRMEMVLSGEIQKPGIFMELSLPRGEIDNEKLNNIKAGIRYDQDKLYLDYFSCKLNHDSYLSGQGLYDSQQKEYSISLQGTNLELNLLNNYLAVEMIKDIEGRVNTNIAITGKGFKQDNINLAGDIDVTSPYINGQEFDNIHTTFWLADSVLVLQDGIINDNNSSLSFAGEINLEDKGLNLEIEGQDVHVNKLAKITGREISDYRGSVDFKGIISNKLRDPKLDLKVQLASGHWRNYTFNDLKADLNYHQGIIEFSNFKTEFLGSQVSGSGLIELQEIYPYLEGNFEANNLTYNTLAQYFDLSIPLKGNFKTIFTLKGKLDNPQVNGSIKSNDTILVLSEGNYPFDMINLKFNWQRDSSIIIERIEARKDKALLMASGEINEDNLQLGFSVDQLEIDSLPLPVNMSGNAFLTGEVRGKVDNPEVTGNIVTEELKYKNNMLDGFAGNYHYYHNSLQLEDVTWKLGDSNYSINGRISEITEEGKLHLHLFTDKGDISPLIKIINPSLPLPENYYFEESMDLTGNINNPEANLELTFHNYQLDGGSMTLAGHLGEEMDLFLAGKDVELAYLPLPEEETKIDLSGKLNFEGRLSGSKNNFDLQLTTALQDVILNNFPVKEVNGEVVVQGGNLLYLDQNLTLTENNNITVNGYVPLTGEVKNLDLTLDLLDLPLSFLSSTMVQLPDMQGSLEGRMDIKGSLKNPFVEGRVFLQEGETDLGLPESFTALNGEIVFENQAIFLENIKGKYGDGPLTITGKVYPFQEKGVWDVMVTGKNLPLNYGSINGRINSEIKITGSMLTPLISAEVIAHDMDIKYPFTWEELDTSEDSTFQPDYDINILPGKDVALTNHNFDVQIQEGKLNLTYFDRQLELEGTLRSEHGSFDYYNNKFMLTEGMVTFNPLKGYIPDVSARAWTRVNGAKITVQLSGPADHMIATFSSKPPLSEEEILALLTSRGGLGEFAAGNWEGIISKEFMRIVSDFLQLDIVNNIEASLQDILSLDRLEIDTYNLGWNQEIVVYLGKYLTEQLYLQFSSQITPEEQDNELAFRYYLDDNILLEGSWQGEDSYSLGIETNISF